MRSYYLLLTLLGIALGTLGPFAELLAHRDFEAGYNQLMHYSSNRLFIWASFFSNTTLTYLCISCFALATFLLSRERAFLSRLWATAAGVAIAFGFFRGDIVALSAATSLIIFLSSRSSPVLNVLGLCLAPQIALISRTLSLHFFRQQVAFGIFILIFAVSYCIGWFGPDLTTPNYPPLAHVVPTFGLLFHDAARIGDAAPIDFPNLSVERAGILLPAFGTLLCGLFLAKGIKAKNTLLGIGAIGMLEFIIPPHSSALSPLRALSRLIPALSEAPIASIYYGVSISSLFACSVRELKRTPIILTLILGVFQMFAGSPYLKSLSGLHFRSLSIEQFVNTNKETDSFVRVLESPSLYPIFLRGARFAKPGFRGCLEKHSVTHFKHELISSSRPDLTANLRDGQRNSRWSVSSGKQDGSEWLSIRFLDGPIEMVGIQPMTGEFLNDYARGLEVSFSERCSTPLSITDAMTTIFSEREWQGELAQTTDGYPYFREQRYTQLLFSQPITAECLMLRQIGKSGSYDWSVTELRIIQEGTNSAKDCISSPIDGHSQN